MWARVWFVLVTGNLLLGVPNSGFAKPADLASKAQAVLSKNCFQCHGENGTNKGRINYITDLARLKAEKKVVPGDPASSKIFDVLDSGTMPPEEDLKGNPIKPPTSDEIAVIRDWISQGAPAGDDRPRSLVSDRDLYETVAADLRKTAGNNKALSQRIRYFTLTNLYNAGTAEVPDSDLRRYQDSLSQIVNSLSWNNKGDGIIVPKSVDDKKLIFRIDLQDYLWTASQWEALTKEYRWASVPPASLKTVEEIQKRTGTRFPVVRADWFLFFATRPPFYHLLLNLPDTLKGLEDLLKVDAASARKNSTINDRQAVRAGFHGYPVSGVAINNRIIERIRTIYGAYWRSYDFRKGPKKDIFELPLGPNVPGGFEQDGGEIIFNLPNGLQAYMLIDAKDKRINEAPQDVVFDPSRPTGIINGISCMSCHFQGIKPQNDQVLAAVTAPGSGFADKVRRDVENIYGTQDELNAHYREDSRIFLAARDKAAGIQRSRTVEQAQKETPGSLVSLIERFEKDVNLNIAAAELGLSPEEFASKAKLTSDALRRKLSPLLTTSLPRSNFSEIFGKVIDEFELGNFPAPVNTVQVEVKPKENRPPSYTPSYGGYGGMSPGVHIQEIPSRPH